MEFKIILQFFVLTCSLTCIFCLEKEVSASWSSRVSAFFGLEPRIVNGTKAEPGQFPHQVSLRRSRTDRHFCGGNVIAPEWILTAGHCMFNEAGVQIQPWTISVVAGQVLLRPEQPSSQRRAVEAIILHADFDGNILANDVALLRLTNPLVLNTPYIKAARLPQMPVPIGTVCEVCGWGYSSEERRWVMNDLMFVSVPTISIEYCRKLYENFTDIPDGAFCAGYDEGLRDACAGDSGGSLVCGSFLTGIVSGGQGCARPKLPGAYSGVYYFRDWIRDHMKNYNGPIGQTSDWRYVMIDDFSNSSLNLSSHFSVLTLTIIYTVLSYIGVLIFQM